LGFLQFVFKTKSYKERTIHEELAKNLSDLLKSNDSTIVKHVLEVTLFIKVDTFANNGCRTLITRRL
jgi:hypothetical protein